MSRDNGLLKHGLRALGYLKLKESGGQEAEYFQCTICNSDFSRTLLIKHYLAKHKELYRIITVLLHAWGLGSHDQVPEEFKVEIESKEHDPERFYCECGKSYNRRENLAYHRRMKGHKKEKSVNEILSLQN